MHEVREEKSRENAWGGGRPPGSTRRIDGPLPELPPWAVDWVTDTSSSEGRRKERKEERQGLIEELKERKLVQWILGYAAVAWMALQLLEVLNEIWNWPIVILRVVSVCLGLGLLPAIVIAWYHGEKGRQKVCHLEALIVGLLVLGSSLLMWLLLRNGLA